MIELKPGIHSIAMADYVALAYLNASACHTLNAQSPYHAKCGMDHRMADDTDASDIGTAIHDGLLEGVNRIEIIEADNWRTKAAKELREAARAAGKIPILAAKARLVQAAIDAAMEFIAQANRFDIPMGHVEQTVIWEEGEVICKARPDWIADDHSLIVHVKTTQGSAEPNSWIRNQLPMYDCVIPFYERGLAEISATALEVGKRTGPALESVFLVIEQNPPHGCSLIGLSPAMYEIAERKVNRAIAIWAECVKSGKWPCYPTSVCYAEPTKWQMDEVDQREMIDEAQAKYGLQA